MGQRLGEFEQMVLLAVMRLGEEDRYGVPIRREIAQRTGRDVSIGAVYTTLDRLERKDLVASRVGAPTAERGGRRRKLYRLRGAGAEALGEAYRAFRRMTEGLEPELESELEG